MSRFNKTMIIERILKNTVYYGDSGLIVQTRKALNKLSGYELSGLLVIISNK